MRPLRSAAQFTFSTKFPKKRKQHRGGGGGGGNGPLKPTTSSSLSVGLSLPSRFRLKSIPNQVKTLKTVKNNIKHKSEAHLTVSPTVATAKEKEMNWQDLGLDLQVLDSIRKGLLFSRPSQVQTSYILASLGKKSNILVGSQTGSNISLIL
jgi:hypothetical protein